MEDESVTPQQWAEDDLHAMVNWCEGNFPNQPLLMLAHSFGGVLLALSSAISAFDGVVLVNSGSAYWGCHPSFIQRLKRLALSYAVIPALSRIWGYFPGRSFGVLGDIPKHVALQVARWSRYPNYMLDVVDDCKGFRQLHAPAISLTFNDDDIFPVSSVKWMASQFESPVPVVVMETQGTGPVGHFNYFNPRVGLPYWPALKLWLDCAQATRTHTGTS
jgi:predicted alpha/beta hydrolase